MSKIMTQWLTKAATPSDEMSAIHDSQSEIVWAQCSSGPVHAQQTTEDCGYTCVGCESPLSFVKSHVRTRNGVEFQVQSQLIY